MATIVTTLTDGGRVEVEWAPSSQLKVQKYDADGAAVGSQDVSTPMINQEPRVVALAGGGFVVVTSFGSRGGALVDARVYDTQGSILTVIDLPGGGHGYSIAASPEGGFLVATMDTHVPASGGPGDTAWRPYLTLYDNTGHLVRGPVEISGDLPAITVQADGDYLVQWNDGGIARTLEIDPSNPPALAKPPAPTLTILDDQGPNTGPITDYTTDSTPVYRVSVSEVGTVLVTRRVSDDEPTLDGGVAVTGADVARGYIDVPLPEFAGDGMPLYAFARFKSADGVVSDATTDHFTFILRPEIWSVSDDAGAQTGQLSSGDTTDDATPTVQIGLESSGLAAGDTLYVRDGSTAVGQTVLTADDVARGYAVITTTPLSDGQHTLTANFGGPGLGFTFTVAASSGASPSAGGQELYSDQYADTLQGGAGADTLHAGRGPDVLTGGGGADAFVYGDLPWNAGHVTDFVVGTDRLDLTALFRASGYTGSDPQADGYICLQSDNAGGTVVFYDTDGPAGGNTIWFKIATLDGVNGATWSQLAGTPTSPPPPPPPSPPPPPPSGDGQVLTSDQYADTLQGGAGADTLIAGQGPDQLTGGAGADAFVYRDLPWNAGHVTDFAVGVDRLDVSAILQAHGYSGSDPVADGWVSFEASGGSTKVFLDTNGPASGGDWPFLITALDGVSVTSWAQVSGGGAPPPSPPPPPPPPPSGDGQVITSPGPGSTLTGGAGNDTLNASQGPDVLTGGGGADHFAWSAFPWNSGHVTDFTPGVDKLDLTALFDASDYSGSDPIADHRLEFRADGQGNTQVYVDRDDPNGGDWPFLITTLDGVSPSQIGAGDWLA